MSVSHFVCEFCTYWDADASKNYESVKVALTYWHCSIKIALPFLDAAASQYMQISQTNRQTLSFVCLCMTVYKYVWLCMTMCAYVWLCMTLFDYVWLCMTMYDYVWLCMTMYDYVRLCMTIYDYVVWVCMAMLGYVWLCMPLYDFL